MRFVGTDRHGDRWTDRQTADGQTDGCVLVL